MGVAVGGGLNGVRGWCGDDRDDVGMTGTTWGRRRRHGDDGEDGEDTSIMINMLAAICNILHVCVCVCVLVHACTHVWGHSQTPDPPPPTCPFPSATGRLKHQNSITLELIKII